MHPKPQSRTPPPTPHYFPSTASTAGQSAWEEDPYIDLVINFLAGGTLFLNSYDTLSYEKLVLSDRFPQETNDTTTHNFFFFISMTHWLKIGDVVLLISSSLV